jgi:hypothetical protein
MTRFGKLSDMTRSTLIGVLGLTLLSSMTGCTAEAWRDAGETEVSAPRLLRVTRASGAGGGGATAHALLAYHTPESSQSLFALPLSTDGRPLPEALVYHGHQRTPAQVLTDLTEQQRRDIVETRLDPAGADRAATAPSQPGAATDWHWSKTYYPDRRCQVALVALSRRAMPGNMSRSTDDCGCKDDGRDVVFPDDAIVLLLPMSQPRPAADLGRARAAALAVTPLTVAADLVIYPTVGLFVMAIYALGGPRC